MNMILYNCEI